MDPSELTLATSASSLAQTAASLATLTVQMSALVPLDWTGVPFAMEGTLVYRLTRQLTSVENAMEAMRPVWGVMVYLLLNL